MLDVPQTQTSINTPDYKPQPFSSLSLEKSEFSARIMFFTIATVGVCCVGVLSLFWSSAAWALFLIMPIIAIGLYDILQRKKTVLRIYPVIGHMRYILESIRPEIQQYFVESDTSGAPFSREYRALVYQRAKKQRDTRPFGTIFDVYRNGYEWVNHSMAPKAVFDHDPRVKFGGVACKKPYNASILNISAMSYGALSKNAIMALNKGAKIGGFAHNTGEGGISPYHLEHGGDLIWQIGTGYFGCRDDNGNFDAKLFADQSKRDVVKMIEIKISQGAKPGHGGILPAVKLTAEIAQIRNVPMGRDVISPSAHSAFTTPHELVLFIAHLRSLSGGKPVGFKLCVGDKSEFLAICKAMLDTGIKPDFITVDGSEGGTGAAPVEMTNSVGMPLREGLVFIHNALVGTGLRGDIRIIASGKVISAFHILRLMALGADTVNAARAMMLAIGCIQARSCHNDKCPTGIATQKATRFNALDVDLKAERVSNYQIANIKSLVEIAAGAGVDSPEDITPDHLYHRVNGGETKPYSDVYDFIGEGVLLSASTRPENWDRHWERANPLSW